MAAGAAFEKVQLLADALALDFSQSRASTKCFDPLTRLLPGLEYLSIALCDPAQEGGVVSSSNCAEEGPTTLHLHHLQSSAAGSALSGGGTLQASLSASSPSAGLVSSWSDVQQMVVQAPSVTHLLCLPFGAAPADGPACALHGERGSGAGALLFGLAAAPEPDARCMALLALLARCLPASMARLSGDTLAFVNFACGNKGECTCCCQPDSEEEEEEEGQVGPGSPCRSDRRGGHGSGGAPAQALLVPAAAVGFSTEEAPAGYAAEQAGPSSAQQREPGGDADTQAAAAVSPDGSPATGDSTTGGRSSPSFSKTLVSAVEKDQSLMEQRPLTLVFRSPLAEEEYGRWVAQHRFKADSVFSLLLAPLLLAAATAWPYRLVETALASLVLAMLLLPPALRWLNQDVYAARRERLVGVIRLFVVAFTLLASSGHNQASLGFKRLHSWVVLWMLSGSQSLCVTAFGLPVRMRVHLPLQFAALCIAVWNLQAMCLQCYPGVDSSTCFNQGAAMAVGCGFLLPTAGLRRLEQRLRSQFAAQLCAAAAHERLG